MGGRRWAWEDFKPPKYKSSKVGVDYGAHPFQVACFSVRSWINPWITFCPSLRYVSLAFCNPGLVLSIPLSDVVPLAILTIGLGVGS